MVPKNGYMCSENKQYIELVTIGISFYNTEKFLGYAIKSVINQSYNNWELILTDDGSTDSSVEVAKKYLYDSRIRLVKDGENKGLAFRLNQQICLAKGKYFARMDADDIMHPERIRHQVEYLETNLHIDVVGSSAYSIDVNNNICGLLVPTAYPNTLSDVFGRGCFIHPSVMAKLNWYTNNHYDLDYIRMEDVGLWAKTILKSNFANLTIPLLFYRDVGVPVLKKYLQTMKGQRKLIHNTFSNIFELLKWKLILKTYIKSFVYIFFSCFRKTDVLIKQRASCLDDNETQNATEILEKII